MTELDLFLAWARRHDLYPVMTGGRNGARRQEVISRTENHMITSISKTIVLILWACDPKLFKLGRAFILFVRWCEEARRLHATASSSLSCLRGRGT